MNDRGQDRRPESGPFGMGWQGYLITAILIIAIAAFAASRTDWLSLLVSAIVLPLIIFPLITALSRRGRHQAKVHGRNRGAGGSMDLLGFLSRTNPILFLFFGALRRRQDDERYQQLLNAGPYGIGSQGYLFFAVLILLPLIFVLIFTAATGQLPTHSGPHFP